MRQNNTTPRPGGEGEGNMIEESENLDWWYIVGLLFSAVPLICFIVFVFMGGNIGEIFNSCPK
jgi:hypothetical protein